ncbi:4'-phosphopantetheinyl transferase family protein [Rhizobium daejeonense]|nr:4'-phosphopantetheinyl transferase superfamily protein [Rhizobium daejeonense]
MAVQMARTEAEPDAALVDIWSWSLDLPDDEIARLATLLSTDEAIRAARFVKERDALRYVAGRGQLRLILGDYLGIAPRRLTFAYNDFGKPYLTSASRTDLHFNLSHSADRAVLAISDRFPLGIDIEQARPMEEDVAGHFFSPKECAVLRAMPQHLYIPGFYRCWTRKEAFVKAHGAGLSLALDAFDVPLGNDTALKLERLDDTIGTPDDWSLLDLDVPEGFFGAVAALTVGTPVELRYRF